MKEYDTPRSFSYHFLGLYKLLFYKPSEEFAAKLLAPTKVLVPGEALSPATGFDLANFTDSKIRIICHHSGEYMSMAFTLVYSRVY